MKSLKAEGDEFLKLTELLESTSERRSKGEISRHNFSKVLDCYNKATAKRAFHFKSKLKDAAEYLHHETLRLSMTSTRHPHYQQVSSSQVSAKELFAREIAALVERN